ncbi:DNA-binding response regulator, NarL/FixJ family, contains REC and HTH domains [Tranquillimonas rosea]|uniref:DNA-binding response regulator, NarL/FixJ family, contains REC and HTH domains n=1 Tax=Tranquillimonas rosea TaxID=641238 RepID=A0A1H9VUI9_9RHOB|nr:DNA-binding response regulator, NarL/FixJ family, contains REC and HTH domains [Tranquillimonas rosea]
MTTTPTRMLIARAASSAAGTSKGAVVLGGPEVACVAKASEVKDLAVAGGFDVALVYSDLPGLDPEHPVEAALAVSGGRPVVLVHVPMTRAFAVFALSAGIAAVMSPDMPEEAMFHVLQLVAAGQRFAPAELLLPDMAVPQAVPVLSLRETQVLEGLMAGSTNKTIARAMGLSEPTVKLHLKTLCDKLGAANRTQAALLARDLGLT